MRDLPPWLRAETRSYDEGEEPGRVEDDRPADPCRAPQNLYGQGSDDGDPILGCGLGIAISAVIWAIIGALVAIFAPDLMMRAAAWLFPFE